MRRPRFTAEASLTNTDILCGAASDHPLQEKGVLPAQDVEYYCIRTWRGILCVARVIDDRIWVGGDREPGSETSRPRAKR